MGVFWLLVLFTNWSLRWCLTHSRCSVCVYWWLSDIASLFAPKGPCSSTRGTAVTGRVPAAGLRPLCQRVLRAPPDGTCRPAGALHAGLVSLLFRKFKGTIILTAMYFALSISLHMWVMNLRWRNSLGFVWTSGLQALFVLQRLAAVLYCYFYKRTALRLADPRFYRDSQWLRKEFLQG
ncbi:transmembrane protein 138 isoform X2 [Heterocephalus glaber]|uniref:Transmembrane protein 138 n=1 Tax=Heterocephalus glaber TaxID=10181 RepID=A0AAX6SDF4_HETGA|nr:transmembrane protein 138 isoform X2 [Heterocephalus glaber]